MPDRVVHHVVRQVVGGHQFNGLAAEDSRSVEVPAVELHLAEAQVIFDRRIEPAGAAEILFRARRDFRGHQVVAPVEFAALGRVDGGAPRELFFRDVKVGVLHAEGLEDAFAEKLVERFSRDDLDEVTDHVRRRAVLPSRAGFEIERQPGELLHHRAERCPGATHGRDFIFVELGGRAAVGRRQAGGVCEDVLKRDLSIGRNSVEAAWPAG